jgi:hypothetical protein
LARLLSIYAIDFTTFATRHVVSEGVYLAYLIVRFQPGLAIIGARVDATICGSDQSVSRPGGCQMAVQSIPRLVNFQPIFARFIEGDVSQWV